MIDFVINDLIENPNFNTDYFGEFLIMSQDFKNSFEPLMDDEDIINDLPF